MPIAWNHKGTVAAVGLVLKEHMGIRGYDSII